MAEDTGYKVDQSVAIFKKIMAQSKQPVFYGDSTGWAKAIAPEVSADGHGHDLRAVVRVRARRPREGAVPLHGRPDLCRDDRDPPRVRRAADAAGATKPSVAFVYSDTEFGRDPIAAGRAKAAKLGIPVALEIITKPGAVDVSAEMIKLRRAKPDFVIFHGYVLAPIPEFIRQMREARAEHARHGHDLEHGQDHHRPDGRRRRRLHSA